MDFRTHHARRCYQVSAGARAAGGKFQRQGTAGAHLHLSLELLTKDYFTIAPTPAGLPRFVEMHLYEIIEAHTAAPSSMVGGLANDPQILGGLDRLTDDLVVIADWQDDLRSRFARATLRFELIGLDPDEQKELEAEVKEFKRVCRGLSFGRF